MNLKIEKLFEELKNEGIQQGKIKLLRKKTQKIIQEIKLLSAKKDTEEISVFTIPFYEVSFKIMDKEYTLRNFKIIKQHSENLVWIDFAYEDLWKLDGVLESPKEVLERNNLFRELDNAGVPYDDAYMVEDFLQGILNKIIEEMEK